MVGALDHPHVIPVYDAGNADGVLYLAMRFIEGPDLNTMIANSDGGPSLVRVSVSYPGDGDNGRATALMPI